MVHGQLLCVIKDFMRRLTSRAADLESRLREQIDLLTRAGLTDDEARLIAARRVRAMQRGPAVTTETLVAFALALAAAAAVKVPALFGLPLTDRTEPFYLRNASLFVLPFMAAYFAWTRRLAPRQWLLLAVPFAAAAIIINTFPFTSLGDTQVLSALHLPIALWLVVGLAHAAGGWFEGGRRMEFVRFSGELFIYYVLIALGGGVLTAFTIAMFRAIGIDAEWLAGEWIVPCGAAGALLVGSWLVESRQGVMENMAPVLTRLFTPLFTILLLVFLAAMAWTGRPIDIERDVLIAFDLLLALVVGLVLYAASARDPEAPPTMFDGLQMILIVSALAVDAVALAAIAARISEFGFTPNRVAALGENLILLVNLAWSARLYAGFLRGRTSFRALEAWQMAYLPVYAAWAAVVVVLFPPLFAYR
jgi:hypothetical protein